MGALSSKVEQTAKGAEEGAFETSLTFGKVQNPRTIAFKASTTNIRVAKELLKLSGFAALGAGVISLGTLYGYARIKPLLDGAVNNTFGKENVDKIEPGSLRVFIRCSTDEIFLKILEDYESIRITERLKDELSQVGIEVEGLKVEIENIEEVNKTKEEINKKRSEIATGEEKTAMEMDTHLTEYEKSYLDEAHKWIQEHGIFGVEEFLREKLDAWKEVTIRFGVSGETGVGKSAFINAIRGIMDDDKDAAEMGPVEPATSEYKHPANSKITFVDLPGLGMQIYYDLQTFCEKFGLEKYDVFLIVSATRITEYDLQLARKLKSMGKKVFFIRTKIDVDIMHETRRKKISEIDMLEAIRADVYYRTRSLMDTTEHKIFSEEDLFLISNYDTNKWDFDRLIAAISDALPVHQRESLTLSLSNITQECLKRKAAVLRGRIWMVAVSATAGDIVPVPGLNLALDVDLLLEEVGFYQSQLGLPDKDSYAFKKISPQNQEKVRTFCITNAEQLGSFIATFCSESEVEELSRFTPFIGSVITGSMLFSVAYRFLSNLLNQMESTAVAILKEAIMHKS